jgi:hypothetical protein
MGARFPWSRNLDTRQDANNSWEILYQDLDVKKAISVGGFRVLEVGQAN